MSNSTEYKALVAQAKELGIKRANTIKAEELRSMIADIKADQQAAIDASGPDPAAGGKKSIEEQLGATGEQVRGAQPEPADVPKLATDEKGRYQTLPEDHPDAKQATIISDTEMDIEMTDEQAKAAGFSQEFTAGEDDPAAAGDDLKPGRIVIHEDLDELQLIDIEMSSDQGPGAQTAIVDHVRMNGIRGRGRRRLVRQFRSRAASIGYKIVAVENKVP